MAKFRKKPVVIEAVKFTPNEGEFPEGWLQLADYNPFVCDAIVHDAEGNAIKVPSLHAVVRTLEGMHLVSPGDWIIRGVKGELYPCKPGIFEATYEPVQE